MPAYRYYRIEAGNNPSFGAWAVAFLAMRSTVNGTNFANTGNTTVSSSFSGFGSIANMYDNSGPTIWLSDNAGGSPPHWVQVDAGSAVDLARIDLGVRDDSTWQATFPTSVIVKGSSSSTFATFDTLATITQEFCQHSTFTFFLPGFIPAGGSGVPYRYWRTDTIGTERVSAANRYELRSTAGGANVISLGTLTASTSFSGSFLPANTQDADDTTRWVSDNPGAQPQSLKVDFGSGGARVIAEMLWRTLTTGNGWGTAARPVQLTIWASTDDVTYVPIVQFSRTSADWAAGTSYLFTVDSTATGARRRRFLGVMG